ncbi:glycosyltransferase family 2 protein [Rheinheimera sp. NSM]|uniref:glycosyltransferase family 2 protein n=1 Tax=Rheinheimera sp. NSM TaxID=3457884 RepID=UPI0040360F8E
MASFPIFSVVIPAYNRAGIIEKAISSVFDQTFEDYEVIVVDDGSTDNTADVVNNMNDARLQLITQENGGASRARNSGIDAARGKYIAFLDSDDVFLPHHLEQALSTLEQGDDICTYAQIIVERGDGIKYVKPNRAIRANEHISEYLMSDRGFVPTISLIVPAQLAKRVRYDENLSKGDDYDFAIRLAAAGGKFMMLSEPSAVWDDQWNPTRLSNARNTQERIDWLNRIRDLITDKAYYAEMGWPVAKYLSEEGKKTIALKHYFKALFKGCFRLKMAIVVFLQVALSKNAYRRMSDVLAKFGVQP